MSKVYVVMARTENSDYYQYAFDYKPTSEEIVTLICDSEGTNDMFEDYLELTNITVKHVEIRTK